MKLNYTDSISAAVIVAVAVALYFHFKPDPAPAGVHIPATQATELKRETTVPIAVATPIQVYKPATKAKLKLPPDVQADTKQHVVASTKTPNDERQHTVTTLLDTSTGVFTTYDRVDPLPWVAVNTKTQVGAFYGLKNGETAIRIQAQQELLQIKALHLGVTASADVTRGGVDTFIGVGAWARW